MLFYPFDIRTPTRAGHPRLGFWLAANQTFGDFRFPPQRGCFVHKRSASLSDMAKAPSKDHLAMISTVIAMNLLSSNTPWLDPCITCSATIYFQWGERTSCRIANLIILYSWSKCPTEIRRFVLWTMELLNIHSHRWSFLIDRKDTIRFASEAFGHL